MAVVVAVAAVLTSGCGTILNFAGGDPDIYGGTLGDIRFALTPRNGEGGGSKGGAIFAALLGMDAAVSFAADTLTLPLAVYMRQRVYLASSEAAPDDSDGKVGSAASPAPADSQVRYPYDEVNAPDISTWSRMMEQCLAFVPANPQPQ
jgi:uncharacterized protein YceK